MRLKILLVTLLIGLLALLAFFLNRPPAPPRNSRLWWGFTHPQNKVAEAEGLDTRLCSWLDAANTQLDLAVFELELPCVVTSLQAAQKRGVRVRIVSDSDNFSPELKRLQAEGISLVQDQRAAFMHHKFVLRDQESVWTGSLNLTPSAVKKQNNNAVALASPELARRYQQEFEEMFNDRAFGPRSPRQNGPVLFELGPDLTVEALFAPEDPVQSRLLDLVRSAQKSIRFLAFSFTDDALGQAMRQRAKGGVHVSGVFEKMGGKSRYSEYSALLKAGLDVRLDGNPGLMHHKVLLIDDHTVVTGSYNFSRNAEQSNDENLLVIHNPDAVTAFEEEFQRVYAQAR
ncbi:MAG: phospholipase D-like domain-containing protein [Candidatus Sericytochromatia bacterium]